MPETLQAHRLFTAAPVDCQCHLDRSPTVPRFAAEAPPSAPAEMAPLTWLALMHATTQALNDATKRLENAKRRRSRPRRKSADKMHRVCNVCAADLQASGFSQREASMVCDTDGKMRLMTLNHRHAISVAHDKADKEGRDMVLLTIPVFIGTKTEATRQVLVRQSRRSAGR